MKRSAICGSLSLVTLDCKVRHGSVRLYPPGDSTDLQVSTPLAEQSGNHGQVCHPRSVLEDGKGRAIGLHRYGRNVGIGSSRWVMKHWSISTTTPFCWWPGGS